MSDLFTKEWLVATIIKHSSVLIKNCLQFFRCHTFAGFPNIRGFHNFPADQNYRVLLPSTNAFDIASPLVVVWGYCDLSFGASRYEVWNWSRWVVLYFIYNICFSQLSYFVSNRSDESFREYYSAFRSKDTTNFCGIPTWFDDAW